MLPLAKKFNLELTEYLTDGSCVAREPENGSSIVFLYEEFPNANCHTVSREELQEIYTDSA